MFKPKTETVGFNKKFPVIFSILNKMFFYSLCYDRWLVSMKEDKVSNIISQLHSEWSPNKKKEDRKNNDNVTMIHKSELRMKWNLHGFIYILPLFFKFVSIDILIPLQLLFQNRISSQINIYKSCFFRFYFSNTVCNYTVWNLNHN